MMIGLFLIPPRRKIFHQSHPRKNLEGGGVEEARERYRLMAQLSKRSKIRLKKRRRVMRKLKIAG